MNALRDSTVAIIGLGLMGGSLALALRAQRACRQIIAIDRDAETLARARAVGAADETSAQIESIAPADIIILATPARAMIEQLPRVGATARAGAVVMDLGSTKAEIVRAMENLPAHLQPIGAHPLCGKERFGFAAADPDLFRGAHFALCPLARTSRETLARVTSLVELVGARPFVLDAARHDRSVAVTSHLPFAVAATLMNSALAFAETDDALLALAASGFRDTSRLAASETAMMLDILLTNPANVAAALRDFSRRSAELAEMISARQEPALRAVLENAAHARRKM